MIPADNLTYSTLQRSLIDLAKNYGFTHSDSEAIECLTSAVYRYMQQVSEETKNCSDLAGRSAACSSDFLLAVKHNRLDIESLNQYMIWNEPIKPAIELPEYPVKLPERPETPLSDTEIIEREEKQIPNFLPSMRIKPKVIEPPEEEPLEEEENIDEMFLAAMKINSKIKPITHASKNIDDFEKLNFSLSESIPVLEGIRYEHAIDFLGGSSAAQEAAAEIAAIKEQIRLEEEAHRQHILEQEKLQYQQAEFYNQPDEPMEEFDDIRQQQMVEFSKQFIPEIRKPDIQKEEPQQIRNPMISSLAEDLFVSPSPSPPPEIKPSYPQEPPSLKPFSEPSANSIPSNDLNSNISTKDPEKEKHKKKHKKDKKREKEKKNDEKRQHDDEKRSKKDKHRDKKKEKKKEKVKEKDKERIQDKIKDGIISKNIVNHKKGTSESALRFPPSIPKIQPRTFILPLKSTAQRTDIPKLVPESAVKQPSNAHKKSEKEYKKKEKKESLPLKSPEFLQEKLNPPSFKFRINPDPAKPISRPSSVAETSTSIANISGSSSSSKGSSKDQSFNKSTSRPQKINKEKGNQKGRENDRGNEKQKEKEIGGEKEKEKSVKRKHEDGPLISSSIDKNSNKKADDEREIKHSKHDKEKKHDKGKKDKERSDETPEEREERKRRKKEKKKKEKEERKRKLGESGGHESAVGEPEQKKQKISEPVPIVPENRPLKIKISLPMRPSAPATLPVQQSIPSLPPQPPTLSIATSKPENLINPSSNPTVSKAPALSQQSQPPKLQSFASPSKPSSTKTSANKKSSSSNKHSSSSSSARHHSSRRERDEPYRSGELSSSGTPKIMSERVQMSKALKESMKTANMLTSRSNRHNHDYERPPKKKRPVEKDRPSSSSSTTTTGEKRSKTGNLSLPSASLPPPLEPIEAIPHLELVVESKALEPALETNDDEDDKFSWCPYCGIRYIDGDNMVQCDRCHYWFHWACVDITSEPQEEQWYCPRCLDAIKREKISKK